MPNDIELELSDLDGLDLPEFDASEYLGSDEAIAAYLSEALESDNAALFAVAVNNIARARGMTEIARKSGLARESLYKALRPGSQPRMETMTRVLQAMNLRLIVQPVTQMAAALASSDDAAVATPAKVRTRTATRVNKNVVTAMAAKKGLVKSAAAKLDARNAAPKAKEAAEKKAVRRRRSVHA